MPTYSGFAGTDAGKGRLGTAKDVMRRAGNCISAAEKAMSDWDDRAKLVFKKWFGEAAGIDDRGDVPGFIYRMNYYMKNLPIVIEDAGATLGANTNAMAWHFQEDALRSYAGRTASSVVNGVKIQIGDTFFNVLKRVQSEDQTQIETIIHELSHLACGTKDQNTVDPPIDCYGRAAALDMATAHPDRARNNAENYGFFCTDIGGETMVFSATAAPETGRKWAVVQPAKLVR